MTNSEIVCPARSAANPERSQDWKKKREQPQHNDNDHHHANDLLDGGIHRNEVDEVEDQPHDDERDNQSD